ncbi:MAG: menaquinone biosynthesis protein [Syntrophomonadaceae bacterium]|nr:menaquinone biosynthesis protein [Syntrophomonadaceae bacterium]
MRPRVGHIQFINCLPLYYGLVKNGVLLDVELTKGTPTELNRHLIEGRLDISPISSIEYARHHRDLILLPDLAVGADGEVRSIILVSRVPLMELGGKTIALTSTSATSQALLQILLRKYGLNCRYFVSPPELGSMLLEADAALLIGDPALRTYFRSHPDLYHYDLGRLWKELTGLPMVYAVWAARREFVQDSPDLAREVYNAFHRSMLYSLEHLREIAENAARWESMDAQTLQEYFRGLEFQLGPSQQAGLLEYYRQANQEGFLGELPVIEFLQ